MIKPIHNVLNAAGYPADITQNVDQLNEANAQFFGQIMENVQLGNLTLPAVSGMEKHPYKGLLHNTDADVYLIGTFPPISYMVDRVRGEGPGHPIAHLDQPGDNSQLDLPQIPFYHGNINALWNVLLPDEDLQALNQVHGRAAKREYLINWLTENRIHYDDIVHYAQRSLNGGNYPPKDDKLCNIRPDLDLVRRVMTSPNLQILAFVNGATFRQNGLGFYVNGERSGQIKTGNLHSDPWSWFMRTCQMSGIGMEMMCDGQFDWTSLHDLVAIQRRYKLAYRMRFTPLGRCEIEGFECPKELEVLTPFSPAGILGINRNPVYKVMNEAFGNPGELAVLREVYARLRERNLDDLVPYNQAI